ncbi:MAG: VanZ family protein [Ignavibacteriales bacterium]
MLRSNLIILFEQIWPVIITCIAVLVAVRTVWIIKNNKKFLLYRELFIIGFAIYIMCLFYVVTFQDVGWSTSNLIPFKEILRYDIGSVKFYKNVIGNMVMFVPFGFFISYFLRLSKIRLILLFTLITSIVIEVTQYKIGRVFDIDDILLNLMGGLAGYYLYKLLFHIGNKLPRVLKKPLFYNIMIVGILVLMVLYLFNIIKLGVLSE